jgi:hypothetical protein
MEIRIDQHLGEQAQNPVAIGGRWLGGRFRRCAGIISGSTAVRVIVRTPENLRDLLVKPHPCVGVNVRVHKRSRNEIDKLLVLRPEPVCVLFRGCHVTPSIGVHQL